MSKHESRTLTIEIDGQQVTLDPNGKRGYGKIASAKEALEIVVKTDANGKPTITSGGSPQKAGETKNKK